jgi:hypothetical protein
MTTKPDCSCSSPRNGYIESFNGKLRDELLDAELFYTLKEAQILVANWRRLYNGVRPHSSRGRRPPAPETILWPGFSLTDYAPPVLTPDPTSEDDGHTDGPEWGFEQEKRPPRGRGVVLLRRA